MALRKRKYASVAEIEEAHQSPDEEEFAGDRKRSKNRLNSACIDSANGVPKWMEKSGWKELCKWVPAINASGGLVRLPSNKELGVWIPLDDEVVVLEINGALRRDKLHDWLDEMIRSNNEPLEMQTK
ncbi:hypothetical protein JG687_00017785 [Phytophthora cactorum]|uniref:Uncharacterized protein n=1 Tax=Phytophthora cactorum TaxID=29920 RepID=A0A329RZ05_9STRA|nr:hypothetical protein Pcac1_g10149 [Phytophthora cactorum]KAG2809278.1 hypothetical protein PC111_g16119 [Phytophthora cactorum]KAG2813172.1 hypothetical protein PC112_g14851 [Phytophthora cactorum]KAG2852376.1 hypothetical protein PC113_g15072 [Phytophthora cactorum]KAG2882690.1 hypothetical protein PC114_g20892 [Phytophthora cactorum]